MNLILMEYLSLVLRNKTLSVFADRIFCLMFVNKKLPPEMQTFSQLMYI